VSPNISLLPLPSYLRNGHRVPNGTTPICLSLSAVRHFALSLLVAHGDATTNGNAVGRVGQEPRPLRQQCRVNEGIPHRRHCPRSGRGLSSLRRCGSCPASTRCLNDDTLTPRSGTIPSRDGSDADHHASELSVHEPSQQIMFQAAYPQSRTSPGRTPDTMVSAASVQSA
jgi:hypothetical protein